jgi:hypothetical protein
MPITKKKAREILHHGEVRGHKLTEKQRRFMGARASGYPKFSPKTRKSYRDVMTEIP